MNDVAEEYGLKPPGRRKGRSSRAAAGDRELPNAAESEAAIIGCVVQAPAESMGACIEKFRGKDAFHDLRCQTIYHVLREMYEKQEAIDFVLLLQRLKDKNVLDSVGGMQFVSAAIDTVPSAANLPAYLDEVWEKFLLREGIQMCTDAIAQLYDCDGGAEELLIKVESNVSALTEANTSASEEHIKAPLRRVMTELEENSYRRGTMQLRGLPTGPTGNYLDKIIGGIRRTFYVTLAGRPGTGKTSMAMNWVEFWACDFEWWAPCTETEAAKVEGGKSKVEGAAAETYFNAETKQWHKKMRGIPVVVFSIEMDSDSLTERLLFGRAGVTTAEYRQGFAEKGAESKLLSAFTKLAGSQIYIDSTPGQSIGQIAAKARRLVKQYGLKNTPPEVPPMVFVLDYIQLVEMEGGDGFDRVKEITKISRKIMALKKQLQCPWIVLAQMNRNIETAERDRKPVLSDLKDCGAIEQDCDLAVFTYRTPRKELERVPENGGMSQEETLDFVCAKPGAEWPWSQVPYRVDLVIPKNRFGPTGDAQMVFCKNLCRFEDWHLWKVKHGVEGLKAGESKHLVQPPEGM